MIDFAVFRDAGEEPHPNETYVGYANERCPGDDKSNGDRRLEACYSPVAYSKYPNDPPMALYLGPGYKTSGANAATDLANHTVKSKFVVAHEMGHEIQYRLYGSTALEYDRLSLNPQPNSQCGCSGLNPTGNEIHCLQSTEQQTAAQVEGYAHFFASNVWNSRSDNHCTFTYYKGFRVDANTKEDAPNLQSCDANNRYQARWAETYCPLTERATEYDWLGFFTTIMRAATGGWVQADLANIYKDYCGFGAGGLCQCNDPLDLYCRYTSYNSALLPSAAARFGTGSQKYLTFRDTADNFGITR